MRITRVRHTGFRRAFRLAAGFLFLAVTVPVYAQVDNRALEDEVITGWSDTSGYWGFTAGSFNYLRNTEYFNDIESGRTLFGTQLHPKIYLIPSKQVTLQAGVFLQSDFGASPVINRILPTFTLKITSRNQQRSFLFGTLEGALAHRLIEPLFDISSAIENRIENGAQFKWKSNRVFLDTWINWEKYIERGSPHKEGFTAGINFTPALVKTPGKFSVSVPVQGTAYHRGGQVDTDSTNMIMVFNGAAGLEIKQEWDNRFIRQVSLSSYYTVYSENSSSGYFPWKAGQGIYPNLFVDTRWLGVMVSYWQGNKFVSPRGTPLYQSVSRDKPGITDQDRSLLFVRFLYRKPLAGALDMSARFEPVYDLGNGLFDFSYSMYLTYRFGKTYRY